MQAIIFLTEFEANTLKTRVDSEFNYPACYCGLYTASPTCICGYRCVTPKKLGNGIFYTTCSFNITTSHAVPFKHPVSNSWAYPVDNQTQPFLSASELSQIITLPNDWYIEVTGSVSGSVSGSL